MSLGNRRGPTIGGDEVTEQKAVVEKYTDGFRTGDLAKILSCLTDDVVWALHGNKTRSAGMRSPRKPTPATGPSRS